MKIERSCRVNADAIVTREGFRRICCLSRWRRVFCSLFVVAATVAFIAAVAPSRAGERSQHTDDGQRVPAPEQKIAPWVMEHTANGQHAEFFVVLAAQADLSHADSLQTKAQKGRYVYDTLKRSQATQGPILQWLREHGLEHRSFYIVNAILVKGTREHAEALAARTDVVRVEGNPLIHNNLPQPAPAVEAIPYAQCPDTIEPGIVYTHAPDVWALGFTGQDIVVGSLDTGVRWTHNALKPHYRGWDGQNADHNYNWHDSIHDSVGNPCDNDSPFPCDDNTHGSHTTGTTIGDDGMGNQVGMAPGAKWIACRGLDEGDGTPARYIECMEWFLAPYPIGGGQGDPTKAPDITINSWFCNPAEGCSPDTLQAAVEAQAAAGIMMVVCAANDGPNCSSIDDPPAIYEAAYTVGALATGTDTIAGFSNRGPVTIDGSGRIKPDVTAPGTGTRSCSNVDDNSYTTGSGTSMATPHIAGAMALLWSAIPSLRHQITASRDTLNNSAVHIASTQCGTVGPPNNVYGWGRVDILAAVGGPTPSPTPTPTATPTPTGTPTATPCSAWIARANVPYNAGGMFAAYDKDDTDLYVGGGYNNGTCRNDLFRYDPDSNSWTPLAASPDQHALSQAVYFKGKLYNMGGFVGDGSQVTNITRIYDIATNTWTTGEPMPATLGAPATVLWNGVIYVAGGDDGGGEVDTLYSYDIASGTWSTLACMPRALYAPGFGAINGKLYIAGGYAFGAVFNTLQIYDIATNTWTTGPDVPQGVGHCGSTVFNGFLYLYGGIVQSNPTILTNITQIYDPASNTWLPPGPTMNVSRWWVYGTAVGNDSIMAPGGINANIIGLNDNEQLINVPCGTPTPTPTATATATPTPTATPTATATPRVTPRPRPTPHPRP